MTKLLLACGIASSFLYAAMIAWFAAQWDGYSSASQTVSELSAIGAPTRAGWMAWGYVYNALFAAFGWGVWRSAAGSRPLRIVGGVLLSYAAISLAWPLAPMQQRGAEFALTDAMHIAFASATVALMLAAIGVGALAFGKLFRYYSIKTLVVYAVFGTLTGLESPRIAQNLPTPWIGVWQRILIGAFLLWIIVLALALWRRPQAQNAAGHVPGQP